MTGLLVAGWLLGAFLWFDDPSPGSSDTHFRVWVTAAVVVLGLPTLPLAGWLVARPGLRRRLGYGLLAGAGLVLAYLLCFAWFGGFCLDENDVCGTAWSTRLAPLLAALALSGLGSAVSRLAAGGRE